MASSLERFQARNQRTVSWMAAHPLQTFAMWAAAMAVVQLVITALLDRPFSWILFLLWTVVFPALMVLRVRAAASRPTTRDPSTAPEPHR
jgi:hypothetical protein